MRVVLFVFVLGYFSLEIVWCERRGVKRKLPILSQLDAASNQPILRSAAQKFVESKVKPLIESVSDIPNSNRTRPRFLRERMKPSAEDRLIKYLHTKLTKYSVPKLNWKPQGIQLYLKFQQIVDVSEKDGVWQARFYFEAIYQSKPASWNRSHFGNIGDVTVPAKMFWHPPIGKKNDFLPFLRF